MDAKIKIYKVVVSQRATQMLVNHARFLAQVSEKAAENLVIEFQQIAESLKSMPERNPWLDSQYIPNEKYRKLLMSKHYLLIYQVKQDTVYIDHVLDCRQDYKWLL